MKIMSSFKSATQPQPQYVGRPVSAMASRANEIDDFEDEPDIDDISPDRRREIASMQRKRLKAREEIQSMARERPGDVAQLIKLWLNT
jgi:flagellar biosynthesis/type III secretory pathway M-ring protein FliF/YscJ